MLFSSYFSLLLKFISLLYIQKLSASLLPAFSLCLANLTPPPSSTVLSLIANAKLCLWILCFAGGQPEKDIMSDRFDCKNCNESLCGRKYIQVEDNPHCIPCYDRLYANTCQECKEIIGHNAKVSSTWSIGISEYFHFNATTLYFYYISGGNIVLSSPLHLFKKLWLLYKLELQLTIFPCWLIWQL